MHCALILKVENQKNFETIKVRGENIFVYSIYSQRLSNILNVFYSETCLRKMSLSVSSGVEWLD
jgi:hypothetical protein